jgi:hypothetical protein
VAFSPDGRQVLSGAWQTLKLWDALTGREIRTLFGHSAGVNTAVFSPDGMQVLSGSDDEMLKLWDAVTGREIRTFFGHSEAVNTAAFSPDGKQVLSGSWDRTLKLWDAETGREIRTFTGHSDSVNSVAFSPDGQRILSGSQDSTTCLWDSATGKEIVRFISFDNGEWLAITPEGYYNASPRGEQYLNVRTGNTVTGIDSYRPTFYKPAVVEARLSGLPVPLSPMAPAIQDAASFSPPVVMIRSPQAGSLNSAGTELSVLVADQTQPLKSVKVLVNGRTLGSDDLESLQGVRGLSVETAGLGLSGDQHRLEFRFPLTLEDGPNRIEVIAANGYSEGRDVVEVTVQSGAATPQILPNLWILAIGINHYDDPGIPNLSYAVADAREIINTFKTQEGRLYRKVESLLIADGTAVAPTRDNIIDNLGFLKQAGQRDVALLFIAGHGVNDDGGNFFFLPSDAAYNPDGTIRQSRTIPNRDIRSMLDAPGQKLVFIDACHSEGTSGRKTRAVENNNLVGELMDPGTVIFTSSRGRELSQEGPEYGHGVFTWAIIQGMGGEADLIRDGMVTMKELDAYVSETVPQLTGGLQHPTTSIPDGYVNFDVARLW